MNLQDKRNHKIKSDYGNNDYVLFYKKSTQDPLEEKIVRGVLEDYYLAIKNMISFEGYQFRMPENCGRIEIRKVKREVEVDGDGKIVNKLPVNWKATNKLWSDNPKAKEKKIKIRYTNEHTEGFIFFPYFIKRFATFKNKAVYKMKLNREMCRNTYEGIMNKKIDAFLLYNH